MHPMPQVPPPALMMEMILGRWMSHAIGVAARLSIADVLAAGPKTVDEIAKETKAHAPSVHRLLRMLSSRGVFIEQEPGRFANTPLSETLRAGIPGSLRPAALLYDHDKHIDAWIRLEHSVRTGGSAFARAHGMEAWEFLTAKGNAETARLFDNAMTSLSGQFAPLVPPAHDFSKYGTLADIGGGHGLLLTTILAQTPSLKGILFDMPQVVEGAKDLVARSGVGSRCEVVGGDFFKQVPTADAYVMKHVIHDWSDDDAVAIMKTIHHAAKPGARLLLVETVLRAGNEPDLGRLLDIEMLVMTNGGRERAEKEYAALYQKAGWKLETVTPTPGPVAIIEGVRA